MKKISIRLVCSVLLFFGIFSFYQTTHADLICCDVLQDISLNIGGVEIEGPSGFFDQSAEPPEIPPVPILDSNNISTPNQTIKINFLEHFRDDGLWIRAAFGSAVSEEQGAYLLSRVVSPDLPGTNPEEYVLTLGNFSLVRESIPANDGQAATIESSFITFPDLPAFGSSNAQSGRYRLVVADLPEMKFTYSDDPACEDGTIGWPEWEEVCELEEPYTDEDFKLWYQWTYFNDEEYAGNFPDLHAPDHYVSFEFEYVAPEQEGCCSSVLFLPGFMASDLYVQGSFSENQLWPPNSLLKTDVEKLMLDSSGNPVTSGIYTKNILDEAFQFNVYKSFIQKMNDLVSAGDLSEWLPFPYDWRKDIDVVVNESTVVKVGNDFENKKLIDEAIALAQRSPTSKITIIGHSNGGLVAQALIKELQNRGEADIVDQLVMVAVPQVGTPKAIAGLLHGDQQALMFGLLLDKESARNLGHNMQSAYNLLPAQKYFDIVSDPVIKFNDSINQLFDYSANGLPQSISGYGDMFDFLTLENRGITLGDPINVPSILRSDLTSIANSNIEALASWQIPSDVKVYEVAGWGEQTVKGIEYKSKKENMCLNQGGLYICEPQNVWDRRLLMTDDGDGTVVIPSAINHGISDEYYLNLFDLNSGFGFNLKHHNILEASPSLDVLSKILTKNLNELPDYISTQKPISTSQNLQLSIHSPVSLGVTDSEGRYTGLDSTPATDAFTFVKEEIPNSYYLEIGDDKYIGLTNGLNYNINLNGEGVGTFTFNQEITQGDQVVDSESFIDIPVTPTTKVVVVVDDGNLAKIIYIDTDGDGTVDAEVEASDEFDPVAYLTVMKSVIKTFNLNKAKETNLIKRIDNLIKFIQKGKIQKASAKSEVYVAKLNTKLQKIDDKPRKDKKITKEEIQIIIQSLEEFIDNLK